MAALDWLHGHIPWWNPYEGIGSPLAGEMQSGAFFPPTLLLLFNQGMLFLQIVLETATGWATYCLISRFGIGRTFSTAGGVAFGLCGTYAWLIHAPIRPIALLPLSIFGVERALSAAAERRPGGWRLLGAALALSILAGFPETTFIDGLFVLWWAGWRIAGPGRTVWRSFVAKLGAGGLVGVGVAAPLLVAFLTFLPSANLGQHVGPAAYAALPPSGLPQLILPYSFGPIFAFQTGGGIDIISSVWSSVGGFLSVTLIAAGLVGLVGRRDRGLRLGLGLWVLIALLRTFGFPPVVHLLALVPGLRLTAFYRYADPSWELAVVVLAAFGLDDIARRLTQRRLLAWSVVITGALATWAGAAAEAILSRSTAAPGQHGNDHPYLVGSLVFATVALVLLAIGGGWAGRRSRAVVTPRVSGIRRRGRIVAGGIISLQSVLLFGFPYASAPSPSALHLGSVHWLQAHLGSYRFATLGPIQPDYGSYFGIAEAGATDLPLSEAWVSFTLSELDTNSAPLALTGTSSVNLNKPSPAGEFTSHLVNFEAIGVRYIVTDANGLDAYGHPFPTPGTPSWPQGPRVVYRGRFAEIWELPSPAPPFSLIAASGSSGIDTAFVGAGCSVAARGLDQAHVHCSRPSVLLRRVQYLPGWSASVNGRAVPVHKVRVGPPGLFQQVSVPAGTSTVHFNFLPPYEVPAFAMAFVAVLTVIRSFLPFRGMRRKRLDSRLRRHSQGWQMWARAQMQNLKGRRVTSRASDFRTRRRRAPAHRRGRAMPRPRREAATGRRGRASRGSECRRGRRLGGPR
ncbi:MAG: hypothetical protein ACYCV7_01270, partial [Acidimicrobiales bacterium]